ncbi:hypothetical protein BD769DRAFT_1388682 [Suillus cothurnatus]|nr:hypothetical protein BD769DRAFT_1388682 [Suillus cothurnatus]
MPLCFFQLLLLAMLCLFKPHCTSPHVVCAAALFTSPWAREHPVYNTSSASPGTIASITSDPPLGKFNSRGHLWLIIWTAGLLIEVPWGLGDLPSFLMLTWTQT